jgi:hypothetical protein
MLMLAPKSKWLHALKACKKQFPDHELTEPDKPGARLMINSFLSDVLGYLSIEEIKN